VIKLIIDTIKDHQIEEFCSYFNGQIHQQKLIYQPMPITTFTEIFYEESENNKKINIACWENNTIIGYASGCLNLETLTPFLTLVIITQSYQRIGIGTKLYQLLENKLKNYTTHSLKISFFNPVKIPWFLQDQQKRTHPTVPGVLIDSISYKFFQKLGFNDVVKQNVYLLELEKFSLSNKVQKKIEELKNKDIEIEFYNPMKHQNFDELFFDLKNDDWKEVITTALNNDKEKLPILVLTHNRTVIGFSGPLQVETCGRGYFNGIGIHSNYRNMGAGKLLFSMLCHYFKEMGASYMTLFTGEENKARYIYEKAGFEIVHSFMVMEK